MLLGHQGAAGCGVGSRDELRLSRATRQDARPQSDHLPCGPLPAARRARKMDATLSGLYTLEGEKVAGIPASVTSSPGVYGDDHGGGSLHKGPALYRFR